MWLLTSIFTKFARLRVGNKLQEGQHLKIHLLYGSLLSTGGNDYWRHPNPFCCACSLICVAVRLTRGISCPPTLLDFFFPPLKRIYYGEHFPTVSPASTSAPPLHEEDAMPVFTQNWKACINMWNDSVEFLKRQGFLIKIKIHQKYVVVEV